jgi:hypothetical protein
MYMPNTVAGKRIFAKCDESSMKAWHKHVVKHCSTAPRGYEFIHSHLTGTKFPSNPRNDLVYAYIAIVLEHQGAIIELIKLKRDGSALTLLRPQVEAAFRGLWVNQIASEIEINCIGQHGEEPFPRFRDMAKKLDDAYGSDGWLLIFADDWATLNGFTHSGLEQLGRRFQSNGNIAPNYPDEIIAKAATYSCTLSIGMLVPIFRTMHFDSKADALEAWLAANVEGKNVP